MDEDFLLREEKAKLALLLHSVPVANQSCKLQGKSKPGPQPSSKTKLPYEMLISKLVDGLETPNIIEHKILPLPVKDYDDSPAQLRAVFAAKDSSADFAVCEEGASNAGYEQQSLGRLPTVSDNESEPIAQQEPFMQQQQPAATPQLVFQQPVQAASYQPMQFV